MALGRTTRGAIAEHVGRPASDLAHHLTVLKDGVWLRRDDDALRPTRPLYRLDDPFIIFHSAIVRPSWPTLERGRAAQVWEASEQPFNAQVFGPAVEELARTWTDDHASVETLGGMPQHVGSTVVADPERQTQTRST